MDFENWAEEKLTLSKLALAIKKPSPHTSLFKYISLNNKASWNHFERTVKHINIVGATTRSLNDPFEDTLFIIDDLQPNLVESIVDNSLESRMIRAKLNGKPKPTTNNLSIASHRKAAHDLISDHINNARILSFCERSDSPLLWSHYANSYKGACIHFLAQAFIDNLTRVQIGYVSYSKHRPILPLSLALRLMKIADQSIMNNYTLYREELDKFCFYTKADDWSYENEIRVIYNYKTQKNMTFKQDGLVSIILGPKMDKENRLKLKSIIRNSPLAEVPVQQARLSKNSFSVEIDNAIQAK